MGVFRLHCEAVNISDSTRSAIVPQLRVDTASELTWIPEPALRQVEIAVAKKDIPFLMANGETTRQTAETPTEPGRHAR